MDPLKSIKLNFLDRGEKPDYVDTILRNFNDAETHRDDYRRMYQNKTKNNDDVVWTDIYLKNDMSNWNAPSSHRISADGDKIVVKTPAGGHGSSGGVNLKFKPEGMTQSNKFCLEFEFRVLNDINWVKGGKMPFGININNGTGGKDWKETDASARLMWRAGGQLTSYLYLCTDQGKHIDNDMNCPLMKNQSKEFKDACGNKIPPGGLSVFRYVPNNEKLMLRTKFWNKIKYGGTLNTKGNADGTLWLELNGERRDVGGIMWTADPEKNKFSQVQFPLWYGGSNDSWASNKEETFKVRNCILKI